MKDWLLLSLRLAAGTGIATWAGHAKVFDAEARQQYADLLQESGIPGALLLTILFGVVEFFGGLFLAAGFFSRQAAGLLLLAGAGSAAIQLLAFDLSASALFSFHKVDGLGVGYFLIAFLLLLVTGSGRISFDAGRATMRSED
ncbi:MAG: DoxX family protein [Planctomycetota bacterium]